MDANLQISLDKLPVKRLELIEENGLERFPSDADYDEKKVSLIRRIDFAWAVEKEDEELRKKKKKKSSNESSSAAQLPWQSMVENLQAAQQELSVIIDLINTVEMNDAVTVASMMNRPKLLPNELLGDLAVSTATKLQCYRHLGKYFKQSAKALEQQIAREARFYGALIRLQKNWKVKRQRMAAIAPGSEGFTIDLFDNTLHDSASLFRPSSLSTIRIDHDSAGMLAINLPPNSYRSLNFGFHGIHSNDDLKKSTKFKRRRSVEHLSEENKTDSISDNECVKETHSLLREVHQAIFSEQVFDMVNREAFNQSLGLNVTGIRENHLQLSISQEDSVFISLVPSYENDPATDGGDTQISDSAVLPLDSLEGVRLPDENIDIIIKKSNYPNSSSCEIYLLQIFHDHIAKAKDRALSSGSHVSGQAGKDGSSLLSHFCMSVAHRIFSNKVLVELENAVCKVPYLHLISHPTWHSRISSWTVLMKVPHSILHANSQFTSSDTKCIKGDIKTEFRTKVVVNDDCISVEAEGAPNVVGLFKGSVEDICSMNKYDCDLADLSVIILQQVASQVIRWLYEEAVTVGMKASRDFLSLSIELEQGEVLSLVGHVDPEDTEGCISWWLVMEDGFAEERKLRMDIGEEASEYRKFLGYLPLDVLHSTLMDLVSLCNRGGAK